MKERPGIRVDHDGTYDIEGWQYSLDWSKKFSGTRSLSDFVRRRKWVRLCAHNLQKISNKDRQETPGKSKDLNQSPGYKLDAIGSP